MRFYNTQSMVRRPYTDHISPELHSLLMEVKWGAKDSCSKIFCRSELHNVHRTEKYNLCIQQKKKLRSNNSSADWLILFFWSFAFGQIIGNPLWGLFSLWSSSNACVYFHFSVPDRERKVCEEDRSVGTKTRYMYLSRQVKLITSWLHRKHSWTFFYLYACLKSWIYVLCIGGNRYLYLGWGLSTLLHWLCGTLNPGHRVSETYPSSTQLFESVWP